MSVAKDELRFCRYRLDVVEGWPDSDLKAVTLRGIQSRLNAIQAEMKLEHARESGGTEIARRNGNNHRYADWVSDPEDSFAQQPISLPNAPAGDPEVIGSALGPNRLAKAVVKGPGIA